MRIKTDPEYGRTWEEDEFIVTLDLYFNTHPRERDARNKRVQETARLLQRTPASIVYRLGNYSAIDPSSTLKGFDNGGKTVKKMFNKYAGDKAKLKELSAIILSKHKSQPKIDTSGIRDFVSNFNSEAIEPRLKECEELHRRFLAKWPLEKLDSILTLENYVIGRGDTDNFCYWVERETRPLGSILGATADKFKVYFDKDENTYRWVKGFRSAQEVFGVTKREILSILNSAQNNDIKAIESNEFFKSSHLFRGKLLYLYFPNRFLNVFAEDDINFFLERLGIEYMLSEHIMEKQAKLLLYKNNSEDMSEWSNLRFGYFLYSQFLPPSKSRRKTFLPKTKQTNDEEEIRAEEGVYVLPNIDMTELDVITLSDIVSQKKSRSDKTKRRGYKVNYIAESIRNKKLGDQGEEIVLKYEKQSLENYGKAKLADKVERVSLNDDTLGYDIKSFTPEGAIKYIDVKATKSGVNKSAPFYLTENEREVMSNNPNNYYLYRVFSANTTTPKLLIIDTKMLREKFQMVSKLWEVFLL